MKILYTRRTVDIACVAWPPTKKTGVVLHVLLLAVFSNSARRNNTTAPLQVQRQNPARPSPTRCAAPAPRGARGAATAPARRQPAQHVWHRDPGGQLGGARNQPGYTIPTLQRCHSRAARREKQASHCEKHARQVTRPQRATSHTSAGTDVTRPRRNRRLDAVVELRRLLRTAHSGSHQRHLGGPE